MATWPSPNPCTKLHAHTFGYRQYSPQTARRCSYDQLDAEDDRSILPEYGSVCMYYILSS